MDLHVRIDVGLDIHLSSSSGYSEYDNSPMKIETAMGSKDC